jgi:hypothetical protein
LFEADDGGGVGIAERLECNQLVALAVQGLVHDAHAAGAEAALEDEARIVESGFG